MDFGKKKKVISNIYKITNPGEINARRKSEWLSPSLKMNNYVAVHNLLQTMPECKCTMHIISIFVNKNTLSDITFYLCEYKKMAKSEDRCLGYRPPCDTVLRADITRCRPIRGCADIHRRADMPLLHLLGECCRCWEQVQQFTRTFPNQCHIRNYHRQVKALKLAVIVYSTTHTLLCMSWMRNCTIQQVILIQWITGLHLRMGIFCHQHCGKLWIYHCMWCVIASK